MNSFVKPLGAVLLGVWVSSFVTLAASKGLAYAFPRSDVAGWGILLWGEHWLARMLVSLLGTFTGALLAGLAAPGRGRSVGTLSALPTSLAWTGAGIIFIIYSGKIVPFSTWWWIPIITISLASPFLGLKGGELGEFWRNENQELFAERGRLLGFHWSTWLWIWVPYYYLVADFTLSIFYVVQLLFLARWGLIWSIGESFVLASAIALGYGGYRGGQLLVCGKALGLRHSEVALRLVGCFVAVPVLAPALRAAGLILLGLKERLPWWLPL